MPFSRLIVATAFAAVLPTAIPRSAAEPAMPAFAEPSISPDRSEIAFASGGDIWVVPARGGQAHLLIAHTATEARPKYSPDGKRLAFTSTRNGGSDIYVMDLTSGDIKRLTFDDVAESLDNWSADGKWIYFSSSSRDVSGANDLWRISAEGGTPMQVSADRYASEYWGAPSPDGSSIAFTARGTVSGQWWRHGHSHIDESEIWLMKDGATPAYTRIGESGGAKDAWPMWSSDGKTIYYVSDRSGAENLYARPVSGGAATKLTSFTNGRVLWPSISADGKAIVFERDFGIWSYDVDSKRASQVSIALRGATASPGIDHLALTTGMQGMTLSPDAKKIAYIVRGEIFAMPAREGGPGTRVTDTPAAESGIVWTPDSRRIIYGSDRDGVWHLFSYDFTTRAETQLTRGTENDISPKVSPDGLKIVYMHGARELHVMDFTGASDRVLAKGYFDRPPFVSDRSYTWSPDSRWVAYLTGENGGYSNAYVVPVTTAGEPRPVSFLPNANSGAIIWSPDGKYLLMDTGQRTEDSKLVRIDLVPRTPHFRENQFRDLFGPTPPVPASPPAQQPPATRDTVGRPDSTPVRPNRRQTQIVFDGIRDRSSILPISFSVGQAALSPDGKSLVVSGFAAGQGNLYLWPMDESSDTPPVLRQLTSTPGGKGQVQWSPDSREVWFVEGGRLSAVNAESRAVRTVNYSAELDVDWSKEKMEVFNQGWSYLRDNFFRPDFNGVNWEATRERFEPYVAGARTPDEMRRVMSLMIGELNASHMGVNGPGATAVTGRIGARFDRAEYETNGRLKMTEVLPLSPLAIAGAKVGDYITAVDGKAITNRTNLDELLAHKTGKQVVVTLSSNGATRDVTIKPVNAATEKGLIYRNWVEGRRAYVEKVSNGRLGYVHMIDMGQPTLDQFILDLDTQTRSHEGVVVDIRNNNGGFVNGYALDVLTRRGYLTMQSRDFPTVGARTALGQRALELPTILVVNQQTLSDGEDFTEGYRAQGLGKVVGEPTAGWIIFTSNVGLIDGQTVIRLPSTRIRDAQGNDMEMHPRPVDIAVQRPIGESYTGTDVQLDAAVKELLSEIATRKK
jgi:Tol biopolymer transport system component/C-terminal processing protease CtpA/Prc